MKNSNYKLKISAAVIAMFAVCFTVELKATVQDGMYFIKTQSGGFALGPDPSARTNALAQLSASMSSSNPSAFQQLIIIKKVTGDLYELTSVGYGGVLSVPLRNRTTHVGGAIFMPSLNKDYQQWKITEMPDGTIRLILSADNILLITSPTGAAGIGTNLKTGIGGINHNDEWRLERVGTSTGRMINKADWYTGLSGIFSSARLRLNNYTPVQNQNDATAERAFIKRNDAFLELSIEGRVTKFDIPLDMIAAGPNNMCKMYINDWNTTRISTSLPNSTFKVFLQFENAGNEIVSNCVNNALCGLSGCPTYDFDNSTFEIVLTPVITSSRVSYNSTVKFNANVAESGPCVNNLFAIFCPSNRDGLIKNTIEQTVSSQIQGRTVKPLVDAILQNAVRPVAGETNIRISTSGNIIVW